jgi:hypothetical protein
MFQGDRQWILSAVLEKTGLHPTEMGSVSSTVIAVLNGMERHFTSTKKP